MTADMVEIFDAMSIKKAAVNKVSCHVLTAG